jgi:hypothetical protein
MGYWWIALVVPAVAAGLWHLRRRGQSKHREERLAAARSQFSLRREWLEARFVTMGSQSGKPRGLAWKSCEFGDGVCFAKDRATQQLRALVAVTIAFEAIEGGGMEDVEAVGNLRAATAVFRHEDGEWRTDGRPQYNLNPTEVIQRYQHELETVD